MMICRHDVVTYIGCTQEQINWGNNDDPKDILTIGNEYIVMHVDVHKSHTKISLYGVEGQFNSVCFEKC